MLWKLRTHQLPGRGQGGGLESALSCLNLNENRQPFKPPRGLTPKSGGEDVRRKLTFLRDLGLLPLSAKTPQESSPTTPDTPSCWFAVTRDGLGGRALWFFPQDVVPGRLGTVERDSPRLPLFHHPEDRETSLVWAILNFKVCNLQVFTQSLTQ